MKTKEHLKLIAKSEKAEKLNILADKIESITNGTSLKHSKYKVTSSEGWAMETDQIEQLDVLFNQQMKVQNKNMGTEQTDASMISK